MKIIDLDINAGTWPDTFDVLGLWAYIKPTKSQIKTYLNDVSGNYSAQMAVFAKEEVLVKPFEYTKTAIYDQMAKADISSPATNIKVKGELKAARETLAKSNAKKQQVISNEINASIKGALLNPIDAQPIAYELPVLDTSAVNHLEVSFLTLQ